MLKLSMRLALSLAAIVSSATAQLADNTDQFFHLELAQTASNVHGLAYDASEQLYVAQDNASLTRIDLTTSAETTVLNGLPLSSPGQLLLGDGRPLVGSDLVLADWNTELTSSCCNGRVLRINPNTNAFASLATGNPVSGSVGDPAGIALGPGGAWGSDLYVMDFQGASGFPPVLFRIDAAGNATTFLVDPTQWTQSTAPIGLAFGSAAFGEDLFVADRVGGGRIWRVDSSANLSTFTTGYAVTGIAKSPGGAFGDYLYFTASVGSEIDLFRVDPSGNVSLVVDNIGPAHYLAGLAFRSDGKALYVGAANQLVIVVPATMTLTATPNQIAANQVVQIQNTTGVANMPAVLMFDQAFGVTLTPPSVLIATTLDATGSWNLPVLVPAGLSGLTLRLQMLSLDAAGVFQASNNEPLQFL